MQNAAKKWLSDGQLILDVVPYNEFKAAATGVDRTKLPETTTPPDAKFPKLERTTLSNGLKVILAQRSTIPLINFNLLVDAGYASDQFALPGTASLAMNVMDEGTKTKNSLQINEEMQNLGAQLYTGCGIDYATVFLSSLKANLDKSLSLFADVILNPSFPEKELDRLENRP